MSGLFLSALICFLLSMVCISVFYYQKNIKCTNYVILFRAYEILSALVVIGASLGTLEAIGKDDSGIWWWFLVFFSVAALAGGVSYLLIRLCKHVWKPVNPEDIVTKKVPQPVKLAFKAVMWLLTVFVTAFFIVGIKKGIDSGAETIKIVGIAIVTLFLLASLVDDIVKSVKALRKK